jgi:hypothetical protein
MTKFSNEITWAFRFYADLESDQPTQPPEALSLCILISTSMWTWAIRATNVE